MSLTLFNSLYRKLTADSTVAGLVVDRIFEGDNPVQICPYIVVQVEGEEDDAINAREAQQFTVSVDCVDTSDSGRDALGKAVKAALNRTTWAYSNVSVFSCAYKGEDASTVENGGNADARLFTTTQTFNIIATV